LAWEILNVFAMYQMGFWWVLYPFPCNVLAVYLLGTLALAPSDNNANTYVLTVFWVSHDEHLLPVCREERVGACFISPLLRPINEENQRLPSAEDGNSIDFISCHSVLTLLSDPGCRCLIFHSKGPPRQDGVTPQSP